MYIVGIDFGHGETTASMMNTDSPNQKVQRLHILDGSSDESCKVESAVCRDGESGEWRFAKDFTDYCLPNFSIHFKAPMNEITPDNREAFSAFVRLVFDHILKNQKGVLEYDAESGEKNFCVYAACPSGWTTQDHGQIKEYKDFMSEIIPIEWIIKESDAAYFKFKSEKDFKDSTVLVIDIGSSTIDFTAYGNNGIESLSDGKKHGASHVEKSIYKYFNENDATFQEARDEAQEPCRLNSINWHKGVLHHIKENKEDYYTRELKTLCLDLRNKKFNPTLQSFIFDDVALTSDRFEGEILQDYRKQLVNDMYEVKAQIGDPNVVILTGGASRMPWLQQLVADSFPASTMYRDTEPSYVVSDGIAYYANAVEQLKGTINGIIREFWEEYTDSKLSKMIWDAFNNSLREIQIPEIEKICRDFENGILKYDHNDFKPYDIGSTEYNGRHCTAVFLPEMIKHNERIIHDNHGMISQNVNANTNEILKTELTSKIENAFQKALHFVPSIDISPSVFIDLGTISIDSEWDINKIIEMTKSIYADWFFDGDIFKDRDTESERKKFSVPFLKIQKEASVNLTEKIMVDAVDSLKKSIKEVLTLENLLSKCIFAIY